MGKSNGKAKAGQNKGSSANKKNGTLAEKADKYRCYQRSVQSPDKRGRILRAGLPGGLP